MAMAHTSTYTHTSSEHTTFHHRYKTHISALLPCSLVCVCVLAGCLPWENGTDYFHHSAAPGLIITGKINLPSHSPKPPVYPAFNFFQLLSISAPSEVLWAKLEYEFESQIKSKWVLLAHFMMLIWFLVCSLIKTHTHAKESVNR